MTGWWKSGMEVISDCFMQALQDAYGDIPYGTTNDYLFRAVLQSNNKVLLG